MKKLTITCGDKDAKVLLSLIVDLPIVELTLESVGTEPPPRTHITLPKGQNGATLLLAAFGIGEIFTNEQGMAVLSRHGYNPSSFSPTRSRLVAAGIIDRPAANQNRFLKSIPDGFKLSEPKKEN